MPGAAKKAPTCECQLACTKVLPCVASMTSSKNARAFHSWCQRGASFQSFDFQKFDFNFANKVALLTNEHRF